MRCAAALRRPGRAAGPHPGRRRDDRRRRAPAVRRGRHPGLGRARRRRRGLERPGRPLLPGGSSRVVRAAARQARLRRGAGGWSRPAPAPAHLPAGRRLRNGRFPARARRSGGDLAGRTIGGSIRRGRRRVDADGRSRGHARRGRRSRRRTPLRLRRAAHDFRLQTCIRQLRTPIRRACRRDHPRHRHPAANGHGDRRPSAR